MAIDAANRYTARVRHAMTTAEIARRAGVTEKTVIAELRRICGPLTATSMIQNGITDETAAFLILLLALGSQV